MRRDDAVRGGATHLDQRANPPPASDVIEGRLIDIGLRALELGVNVVIDFGLWRRDERSALRQAAADLGAAVEMRYFELPPARAIRDLAVIVNQLWGDATPGGRALSAPVD